jgi:hypothetical protein
MNGPVECPVECVTFSNVIVDDIVLWDGRTLMGTLGGGGTHALVGMRVWGARPRNGFVAWTGVDFDPAMRAQLERIDVDPSGLYERPDPTTRAWQIIERDDRRTEIFRTDLAAFVRNSPTLANIPAAWLRARGMHLMTNGTVAQHIEFVAGLRRVAPDMVLVFEPAPVVLTGHRPGARADRLRRRGGHGEDDARRRRAARGDSHGRTRLVRARPHRRAAVCAGGAAARARRRDRRRKRVLRRLHRFARARLRRARSRPARSGQRQLRTRTVRRPAFRARA